MGGWQRSRLAGLVVAMYLLPAPAFAQTTKAGVVTTLEGNVTAVRAVMLQPVLLKFRDDVFLHAIAMSDVAPAGRPDGLRNRDRR
jgi:hypothetical protein